MDSLAIKESKLRELAHKRQRTTPAGLKKLATSTTAFMTAILFPLTPRAQM